MQMEETSKRVTSVDFEEAAQNLERSPSHPAAHVLSTQEMASVVDANQSLKNLSDKDGNGFTLEE